MTERLRTKPPPPPLSDRERRRHERLDLIAQVEVTGDGEVWLLPASNISAGGVYVELGRGEQPSLRAGTQVGIHLDLGSDADGQPLTLTASAEIIRVDLGDSDRNAGFAMMWTSPEPAMAEQLARLLRYLQTRPK